MGERNWLSRYPWAEWIWTPSNPADLALRAASAKAATTSPMSRAVISPPEEAGSPSTSDTTASGRPSGGPQGKASAVSELKHYPAAAFVDRIGHLP